MNFLPFIIKRASRNWRLLLVVAAGVLVSTGLLASAPILVDTVIELGLPRRLAAADPEDVHLRMSTFENVLQTDVVEIDDSLKALVQTRFAGYVKEIDRSLSTFWLFPWRLEAPQRNERVNFRFFEDLEDHVRVVSGTWPQDFEPYPGPDGKQVYPVIAGEPMALEYDLSAGSLLPLSTQSGRQTPDLYIKIAAVVQAVDPTEPYWLGSLSPLVSQANQRYEQQYSVFVPEDRFYRISEALFPKSNAEIAWHVILDLDSIHFADVPVLINAMVALPEDLGTSIAYQTDLLNVLLDFYTQSGRIRAPLLLLTSEIVLLALVYVVMTSSLAVRAIEREFAILRSRGASRRQIFRIQATEAALVALVAFISGPGLGSLMVRVLGRFGPLAELAGPENAVHIPGAAWTAAFYGALAGAAGLLLPVWPALKRSIVHQVQVVGREKPPLWQRLYLDVMLLTLGLVLLFRLQFYGGLTTGSIDWLLLLSPLTILLGAATLVLRIAPPILRGLSALVAESRGLAAPLAFWQTARNPGAFAGLVVLLTLSAALGTLATGLNATLNASEIERARYATGSRYRLEATRSISSAEFAEEEGVERAVSVWRAQGTVNLRNYRSFPVFDLLAIEPRSFAEMTVYRSDFSEEPMGEVLGTLLTSPQQPGLQLPGRPDELGMWVFAQPDGSSPARAALDGESDRERLGYFAKIRTSTGESFVVELQPAQAGNETEDVLPWLYFHAPLKEFTDSDYPLTLHSLWFRQRAKADGRYVLTGLIQVAIDDIQVRDRGTGEMTLVEDFEDPIRVIQHEMRGNPDPISLFVYTQNTPHSGNARANLLLSYNRVLSDIGLVFQIEDRDNSVLPAVVSRRFIAATDVVTGEKFEAFIGGQPVTFQVTGVVDYFPTLYETEPAGFLVTTSAGLLTQLGNASIRSFSFNEVLLDTTEGLDTRTLTGGRRSEIARIWDYDLIRQLIKADPMALGLRGVTYLGYFLTSLLSIFGFSTYFYMSIRRRARSFGILRAMGLSPRQLYASLATEQGLIVLTGLGLGAFLGAFLNDTVLPGLPVTLGNLYAVPPFLPRSDWYSVLQVFITLLIAFALTFGAATWLLWRSKVHEALRYE